ncbi:MAG: hypothetical protein AAGH78_07120 [Cyanobacteria bacterium P01_H01_bin.58]
MSQWWMRTIAKQVWCGCALLSGIVGVGFSTDAIAATDIALDSNTCGLEGSVYRDANQQGFELKVAGPDANLSLIAPLTVTIQHQEAQLYYYAITISSGYASYYLMTEHNSLRLDFFQADLTNVELDIETAPAIAFISGLGSHDYYNRRGMLDADSPPLIGDTLWLFERCES